MARRVPKTWKPRGALGKILMAERRRLGLSITEASRRAGWPPSHFCEYERGIFSPGPRAMLRLLKALDLPEEFGQFLVALGRIDKRLSSQVEAIEALRAQLGEAGHFFVRDGLALVRRAQAATTEKSVA